MTKTSKAKRQKHDYTSELELKCLLIRTQNKKINNNYSEKYNTRINRYIRTYIKLDKMKYADKYMRDKRINLKRDLKSQIIRLSEKTNIDYHSYEQFGKIILLMIKNILKKPNFSGYTYTDDFYSDAVHKIIKYAPRNFKHNMISKSTNQPINAFAYISQIIHNSILFIIKSKSKDQDFIKKHIHNTINDGSMDIKEYEINNDSTCDDFGFPKKITIEQKINIEYIDSSLIETMQDLQFDDNSIITVTYPKNYKIGFDEYDEIKDFIEGTKKHINLIRNKKKVL